MPKSSADPTSAEYVELARTINAIASDALKLKSRPKDLENARAKVAIGLSLQAAELLGKGMLRALGATHAEIRKHARHNLIELYDEVEKRIVSNPKARKFQRFLLSTPVIDGRRFGSTTRKYLADHFAHTTNLMRV